jgi:hypothetical protein
VAEVDTETPVDPGAAQVQEEPAPPVAEPAQPEVQQSTPPPEVPQEAPTAAQPTALPEVVALPPEPLQPEEAVSAEAAPDNGVVVNWVELIDTATQMFAWVWLCFGVVVILLIPFAFIFMQIRGARLNR